MYGMLKSCPDPQPVLGKIILHAAPAILPARTKKYGSPCSYAKKVKILKNLSPTACLHPHKA